MRLHEILRETTQQQLAQDLQDLLVHLKGIGKSSIETDAAVSHLSRMGHAVTPQTLMQVIAEVPLHLVADEKTISVDPNSAGPGGQATADDGDDGAEQVSKMAKRAVDKEF